MEPCPKVIGADYELANSLLFPHSSGGHWNEAAQRLLDEIPGYPLQNSAYSDCDHLEINLPEHAAAADHAALMHAGLRIARQAQVAATRKLGG